MALLSKKDFANHCGVNTRRLSVEISRSKVVEDENEMIDPDHEKNIAFFARIKSKQASKSQQVPRDETWVEPELGEEKDEAGIMSLAVSEKRKKHFDATTQQSIAVLKELDIQRKTGEAIPTVAVEALFDEALRLFAIGYRDLYEREVQKISVMAGFSAKDIADLRNSGINNINLVYKNTIELCKSSISVIVGDNALKRGVGERL